jgi:hypothetical protein
MAAAFQGSAFQTSAFQSSLIVSTRQLSLPINCVLAGQQLYDRTGSIFEPGRGKSGRRVIARASASGRLGGDAPSFTVTKSGKGY